MNYTVFIENLLNLGVSKIQVESLCRLHNVLFEASESTVRSHAYKILDSLPDDIQEELKRNAIDRQNEQREDIKRSLMQEGKPVPPDDEIQVSSWERFCFEDIKSEFALRNNKDAMVYAPGLARIAYTELNMGNENEDSTKLHKLAKYLNMIVENHKDEFTENFGHMQKRLDGKVITKICTFMDLDRMFGEMYDDAISTEYNEIGKTTYTPNNYEIVWLKDYSVAQKYCDYTRPYTWCYFDGESTFNGYTNGGRTKLYLALKPGFENLHPGDKGYGQSMIGIDVDPGENGLPAKLVHASNRYNHAPDPELDNSKYPTGDNRFNATELSKILGAPFWKVCPPYTKDELKEKGIMTIEDLTDEYNKTHNIKLFHDVYPFFDGLRRVYVGEKSNLIDENGNLISKYWFDSINLSEGLGLRVEYQNKYNIMDEKGRFAFDHFIEAIGSVHNGYFRVTDNGLSNFINVSNGKFLSDEWFSAARDFRDGVATVKRESDGKCNVITTEGTYISPKWYDNAGSTDEEGFTVVYLDGKANYMKKDGSLLLGKWVDKAFSFSYGNAVVVIDYKKYIIDRNGKFITNEWFDTVSNYAGDIEVMRNRKANLLRRNGQLVSKIWFDSIGMFDNGGGAHVKLDNKCNILKRDGTLLSNMWFDGIIDFRDGFYIVNINRNGGTYRKWNVMKPDGKLVSRLWFDKVYSTHRFPITMEVDGCKYEIDDTGNVTLAYPDEYDELDENQ